MSNLSLDFSDASFDQDDVYRIDSDGFVYEMSASGPPSGSSTGTHLEDSNGDIRAKGVTSTISTISGLDLTVAENVTFDFEFVDVDGNAADTTGDQYKVTLGNATDVNGNSTTQEFYASETLFAGDLTNGGKAPVSITEVTVPTGARSIHLTTPFEFTTDSFSLATKLQSSGKVTASELKVDVVGSIGSESYTVSVPVGPSTYQMVTVESAIQAFNDQTGAGVTDLPGLVTEMWSETTFKYMGDLGQGESWVVSGDTNGRNADQPWTNGDDIIAFQPGTYNGVFEGGTGFDTLVFEHYNLQGQPANSTYIGLDSGFAYFHGAPSPIVKFAETGPGITYAVDWERLEVRGDSDDTVVVGGGLKAETDTKLALDPLDTFQIDLGSGDDLIQLTNKDNFLHLDMSKTGSQTVELTTSGSGFQLISNGYERGHDGKVAYDLSGPTGDQSRLEVNNVDSASDTNSAIDYMSFGDDTYQKVTNTSHQGIAIDFGSSNGVDADEFIGKSVNSSPGVVGADIIDLRGVDGVISIDDGDQSNAGTAIDIDVASANIDIEATNVDVIMVSQLSGSTATSDEDYLVNKEYLYGDTSGVLGQKLTDYNGDGFDVITSAKLDKFGTETDAQIFYDGNHNDFTDTLDTAGLSIGKDSFSVTTSSDLTNGSGWEAEVEAANSSVAGGNAPTFYVEINGSKVAVHYDEIGGKWKIDTTALEISSSATIDATDASAIESHVKAEYGVSIDGKLGATGDVYLNATETDIESLLGATTTTEVGNVLNAAAHNFSFYTQVEGAVVGSSSKVNVNVALDYTTSGGHGWKLSQDDVLVETSYNSVKFGDGDAAVAGGRAAEFIEMDDGAADSVALGNGGNDVYQVDDSGDKGVINELGNLMDRTGGTFTGSAADTVQFELVDEMFELDFSRGNIAGEAKDSTLFIASEIGANAGEATLFDQYNAWLPFRQTEYVMIGDGATADEIFEIADGSDITTWHNEVYVADSDGGDINVVAGGEDHVFLEDSSDIDNIVVGTVASDDEVVIHNFGANDTVNGQTVAAAAGGAGSKLLVIDYGESGNEFTLMTNEEWMNAV